MKITIECHCGRKYEAEFEPVNGHVPNPIVCPDCGTDATDMINNALAQQSPAAPARPKLRKAEPAAAPRPRPRVATAPSPTPVATEAPPHCFRHEDKPVEMFCFVCKKPMCTECMALYGFVCSPYCRQQAKAQGLEIPAYEKQRDVVARQRQKRGKRLALAAGLGVVALLGVWIWYAFWGSQPHVARTLDLGQGGVQFCRFIGPNQLLVASAPRVLLYDTAAGKTVWSAPATLVGGVFVTPQDIWLQRGKTLIRLDRHNGTEKSRVTVTGAVARVTQTESSLVVDAPAGLHQMRLTQIDLATGKEQSAVADMLFAPLKAEPVRHFDEGGFDESEALKPQPIVARTQFIAAGPNVAQLDVQITKTNVVAYQAIKDTGQKRADSEMKVSESAKIAEEIMTDMQRQKTGGVRWEDESQYHVTLRRLFGNGITNWTGEVTGPPALFAMKSVDVLIAGKQLIVFDKQNHPLWESKLTYPVAGGDIVPCLEAGETLYVFDPGVLTAFTLKTGQVRWRLASVGISQLALDTQGKLYVTTTTASPEDIQYTQQVKLQDRPVPVILKVDPATGKTLWKLEKTGDHFYLADGFVYFTRSSVSGLEMIANVSRGKGAPVHFRIFRVDPRRGKTLWEYHREGSPEELAFQRNTIVLITEGRLEVLKYLTF